jgi:hypothetical protein
MGQGRTADRCVSQAVRDPAAQVSDQWVIRVQYQARGGAQPRHRGAPQTSHEVHLTVTIELVTEDVVEQQYAWLNVLERERQGRLVDFEQADVAARAAAPVGALGDRAKQTRQEIRARAVVDRSQSRSTQEVREQAGGGCLPIRARHDYAPLRERACDVAQRVRRKTWNQVPGDDGPPAASEASAQTGRGTASQQGSTVSRTHGRSLDNYMRDLDRFLRLAY